MLTTLQNIFKQHSFTNDKKTSNNELMLLCGIMMEAAAIDGTVDQNEILKIKTSLITIFNEKSEEVEDSISSCLEKYSL